MERFGKAARRLIFFAPLIAAAISLLLVVSCGSSSEDTGWQITSFASRYIVNANGTVEVIEDIQVDFNDLQRHGIYRRIPAVYAVGQGTREIQISAQRVTDGATSIPFISTRIGSILEIKIGDPNRLITGFQRYRIEYTVSGALNGFPDHDEFYWNVTGTDWDVPMLEVSAQVQAPDIIRVTCYEGKPGSQDNCESRSDGGFASFVTTTPMPAGSGLTIVVSLPKGSTVVLAPAVSGSGSGTPAPPSGSGSSLYDNLDDFFGFNLPVIGGTLLLSLVIAAGLYRFWWTSGADLWYGDRYLLKEEERTATTKPPFAHETIPVEYTPPELGLKDSPARPLRPAEVGVLLKERVSDIDVTATIVDLAVRKYLVIRELPKRGLLARLDKWVYPRIPQRFMSRLPSAMTRSRIEAIADYELECLRKGDFKAAAGELLPYEALLFEYLFAHGDFVRLSALKGKFAPSVARVEEALMTHMVRTLRFFVKDPESARSNVRTAGIVTTVLGVTGLFGGANHGAALLAVPIVACGVVLTTMAGAMPRRTAMGREMFRRSLGFREYMVTAEADIQGFLEEKGEFSRYLPYAIVMGCTNRWAEVFQGIEFTPADTAWYAGLSSFEPTNFVLNVDSFSRGTTGLLTLVPPGSSGGSGFSGFIDFLGGIGLGGVGGGLGGGGGGSW
ncbi:MAG: DUF2207 domain-containing protein [Dehalococcoidia bacterium]